MKEIIKEEIKKEINHTDFPEGNKPQFFCLIRCAICRKEELLVSKKPCAFTADGINTTIEKLGWTIADFGFLCSSCNEKKEEYYVYS